MQTLKHLLVGRSLVPVAARVKIVQPPNKLGLGFPNTINIRRGNRTYSQMDRIQGHYNELLTSKYAPSNRMQRCTAAHTWPYGKTTLIWCRCVVGR